MPILYNNSGSGGLGSGGDIQSTGGIDIINDFPWTITPAGSRAIKEVPQLFASEYQITESQLAQMFTSFYNAFAQGGTGLTGGNSTDPYAGLYDTASPTGFSYTFPYFNDTSFANTNSWQEINTSAALNALRAGGYLAQSVGNVLQRMSGGQGKFARGTKLVGRGISLAGTGTVGATNLIEEVSPLLHTAMMASNAKVKIVDKPQMWNNGTPRSYTVEFPLYNMGPRVDEDASAIQKNYEFCWMFTYQNLYNKRTYFTATPPVIYRVTIPGVHYSYAAHVSDLKILNKGNLRKMSINGQDVMIPDAYWVSITFTDLLVNSKNLFKLSNSNSQVTTN